MTEIKLKDAAYATPDPERAFNNLSTFLSENPARAEELKTNIRSVSLLFSVSQFLATYCTANPDILFDTLKDIDSAANKEVLAESLEKLLDSSGEKPIGPPSGGALAPAMTVVRAFRMREMLKITLRDILRKADLVDAMLELSALADAVIETSLRLIRKSMTETYGSPADDAFAVIALGKLGGEELNFSSDVDLIFVYGTEVGETTGISTPQGVVKNRISNHEYYCKTGEALTRFLSLNTEAGFAYRVDLRLRPEGQRGDIALALRGYEMYYESWGRAWERAMLIRARPNAGDIGLGKNFIEMIRPFVYRKYLDFSSIDEIRKLKTRIDSTFKRGDIKRGYGGIREIEFFAQALQLIYGGRETLLRERSILKVLHRLMQKSLIGQEDYSALSENYVFLRTLEHRLQQLNDLQTHTLPSGKPELEALGKKMGFHGGKEFVADLETRRTKIRNIYDSLFAEKREEPPVSGDLFDEELSDSDLRDYLKNTSVKDVEKALRNIKAIRDSIFSFQTLKGRRLLGDILPAFVDSALRSGGPDTALNHLQSFAKLLSTNEAYLEIFVKDRRLIDMLTYVFSQSEYLSKKLLSRPQYLEMIGWEAARKKNPARLRGEIEAGISGGHSLSDAIRLLKQAEEIRLGLLFLQRRVGVAEVTRGLTKAAEAILSLCAGNALDGEREIAVIGLGKLGGREIAFNSDLDIIFVAPEEVDQPATKAAEKFLRLLISYTREGVAYRIDTRLRPEGSKGPLISPVASYRDYYSKAAAFWEFQALLKARPVAGDVSTGLRFVAMAKEILVTRGGEIPVSAIVQMRQRILRELSKEAEGYDIKLGPGGIEEIEFAVQFLQLANCRRHSRLLVQGTLDAIRRLTLSGVIGGDYAAHLKDAYLFYRTLECFLRLKGETILRREEETLRDAAAFMGFRGGDEFTGHLEETRRRTGFLNGRYVFGP